ncbi:dual specificity protein phosphatase family protein [Pseudorhodobacter turbinis]|uniref:Dual specificity protein phosphatase family protein n=1 Tax=Pseudorhodobacter turbinis TaxID=2500533 RepID=A0A4P8EEA3_9RHOB|nr:dual specificity protein phosphatase [Pseudorhodobacter turbinis]QCO55049.1 dual specificity protein phosphatase family protein [Pseudorhodobacter turbinis]
MSPRYERPPISLIEKDVTTYGVSLYIGGRDGASDMALLREHGITTVVNCAVNLDFNLVPDEGRDLTGAAEGAVTFGQGSLRYYKIGLVAGYYILRSALVQELPDRPSYPHRAKGNVLLNCRGGRSRSVSLGALFLHRAMPETYPTLDAAIQHVQIKRELRPDEWFEAPKPVLVDAARQASRWIDMIGHDAPQMRVTDPVEGTK